MSKSGTVRLDARGRLVLPLELRRRLGLEAGDQVRISEGPEGVLRIETGRAAARALIGSAGAPGSGALEDLRDERREQLRAEEDLVTHTHTTGVRERG